MKETVFAKAHVFWDAWVFLFHIRSTGHEVHHACQDGHFYAIIFYMDKEQEKQWVAAWGRAGARLAELEREDLRKTDTQKSLMNLACAYESCRLHHKPRPTSGLVEQQRWFRKLRS